MSTLAILSLLFAIAAVFGLLSARWLRMPITIGTMLLTVLASAALTLASGLVPGIHRWAAGLVEQINFERLILHGMLPLLLFAGAFLLDLQDLAREKLTVALLSVVGTAFSFLLVALLMLALSGSAATWMECLLFGALVSPTDPIAVLEMLRRVGIPKRIQAQLAGESLFNDGIGAVLFITMLDLARGNAPTPWHAAGLLLAKAGGGVFVGVAAAWIVSHLMRRVDAYQVDILLTVALALGGYVLADELRLSAPLEAVVAGIALRHFNERASKVHIAHGRVDEFWKVIDEVQNSVLFVLLGLEAMAIPLDAAAVRAGAAGIVAVNTVRLAAVALILLSVRLLQPGHRSSTLVLTWGGLRGGLSIALALSVPQMFGRSWILGATYLVVVFSIVVQGGSMNWLLRRRRGMIAAA
ncbi:MAG TPA: sodium:proton antiporter [Terracidiphilus sp.]|nr:sodium:proton antiporter [Terracidiphilus sp.]